MHSVLIVDDNRPLAENLAEILADEGNAVQVASGGLEALVLLSAKPVDLLLTDLRMERMSGPQLVHLAKQLLPGLPAIVMTAYAEDAALDAAFREGVLAILPKPVPVSRVLELLQSILPRGQG